jgi:D-alanyl-D-alanine carboxypeptidase
LLVPAIALASTTGARAAGTDAVPTTQSLASMKAQADAVQLELTAGATRLEAARATLAALQAHAAASGAAALKVNAELAGLRDELAGYVAELYVHPAAQAAATALTSDGDLAGSLQGVEMLSIVNRGRSEVLRQVVVAEQRAQLFQTQATQAVAAATLVQKSVIDQVAALQLKSATAAARLTAAQAAYQAELQRVAALRLAALRLAAAKAARDKTARAQAARDLAARALAARQAALSAEAAGTTASVGQCDAAAGPYPAGAWGGYADGLIPVSRLCAIIGGGGLRPDAAVAFNRMSQAYAQAFGTNLCVSDSYRTYSEQVSVFRHRPSLAAVPGTSNHGWGLAVDLGCGVERSGSAQYRWMTANAGSFGWVHPAWAVRRPFEPWHWEFGHLAGGGGT